MARPFNVRRALLRAVDAFLEATPASQAHAHRLVRRCKAVVPAYTLDDIVWGGIALHLSDPITSASLPALQRFRSLLRTGSPDLHRAYVKEDFDPEFTPIERTWCAQLAELLDFFDRLPLDRGAEDTVEYEGRVQQITQLAAQSPAPPYLGSETIYHLVLREVTAIVTAVAVHHHPAYRGRLLAQGPYARFGQLQGHGLDRPDVQESLLWARHALRSIAADSWLLITWQVTPQHYNLSLH